MRHPKSKKSPATGVIFVVLQFLLQPAEAVGEQAVTIVPHRGAESIVGVQQLYRLVGEIRAATALAAHGRVQQLKAQRRFGVADDVPRLGVGHLHPGCCSAQRMKPIHLVEQLCNAGTEALGIGKEPACKVVSQLIHISIVSAIISAVNCLVFFRKGEFLNRKI